MLTSAQAVAQLNNITTEAQLRNLVASVSADAPGGATVLYSGQLGNVSAGEYAKATATAQGGRIIDKTEVFDFLNNREFKNRAQEILGLSEGLKFFDDPSVRATNTSTNTAWDIASKNFVNSAPDFVFHC